MPRGKSVEIALTAQEREELERNLRRRRTAPALAGRSRMVLLAADGLNNEEIAERVGVWAVTVGTWRRRFAERRLEGLKDGPRVGRPREITDGQIEAVILATLEGRTAGGSRWSTRSLAERMGMSQSAISRIWRTFGLEPRRPVGFGASVDAGFAGTIRDVVGLYLSASHNAVVFGVVPGGSTKRAPRLPPVTPPSALATDEAEEIEAHHASDFAEFLALVDAAVPAALGVFVLADDVSAPRSPRVRIWVASHPRFRLHATATHEAWLQQVELWCAASPEPAAAPDGSQSVAYELQRVIESVRSRHDARPFVRVRAIDTIARNIADGLAGAWSGSP